MNGIWCTVFKITPAIIQFPFQLEPLWRALCFGKETLSYSWIPDWFTEGVWRKKNCLCWFANNKGAYAQSDQRHCHSLIGNYQIKTCYNQIFNFLASLCSWGDWFESHFVGNPEDRFCCIVWALTQDNLSMRLVTSINQPAQLQRLP